MMPTLIVIGVIVITIMVAVLIVCIFARKQYLNATTPGSSPEDRKTGFIIAASVLSILGLSILTYFSVGLLWIVSAALGIASLVYLGALKYKGEPSTTIQVTYWTVGIGAAAGIIGGLSMFFAGFAVKEASEKIEDLKGNEIPAVTNS